MSAALLAAVAFVAWQLAPAEWAPPPAAWALASAAAWALVLLLPPGDPAAASLLATAAAAPGDADAAAAAAAAERWRRQQQRLRRRRRRGGGAALGERILAAWGIASCAWLLGFLRTDPTFEGWQDVYWFCGRDLRYCGCDLRSWTTAGWRKAAVLWSFALTSALGAQRLAVRAGLGGVLRGEWAVTYEAFVSVCWRIVPYMLNQWERRWGAECSSMVREMFELPHFATELLVVLPCAQLLVGRLRALAAPQVSPLLPGGPQGAALAARLYAPHALAARWEFVGAPLKLGVRLRANRRALAAVVFVCALAAANALAAPLRLEEAAMRHPLRRVAAAAAALPANWTAPGEGGGAAAARLRAAVALWSASGRQQMRGGKKADEAAAAAAKAASKPSSSYSSNRRGRSSNAAGGEGPLPSPPSLPPTVAAAAAAAAAGRVPWLRAAERGVLHARQAAEVAAAAAPRGGAALWALRLAHSAALSVVSRRARSAAVVDGSRGGGGSSGGKAAAAAAGKAGGSAAAVPTAAELAAALGAASPEDWEALARRLEAHGRIADGSSSSSDAAGACAADGAARVLRNLHRHAKELSRMAEPRHRALVAVVEAALALMRLGCERFFVLASLLAAYTAWGGAPPPAARRLIVFSGRLSAAFQAIILSSFPAVCWLFGAGAVFSSFVTVVFWGAAAARFHARVVRRLVSFATAVRGLVPAGPREVERMHGSCPICWRRMTAAAVVNGAGGGGGVSSSGGGGGGGGANPDAAAAAAQNGGGEATSNSNGSAPAHDSASGSGSDDDDEGGGGGSARSSEGASLPCGHAYHPACLQTWLEQCRSQGTVARCPMCQSVVALAVTWRLHAPWRAPPPAGRAAEAGAAPRQRQADLFEAASAAFWRDSTNYVVGRDQELRLLLFRSLHAPGAGPPPLALPQAEPADAAAEAEAVAAALAAADAAEGEREGREQGAAAAAAGGQDARARGRPWPEDREGRDQRVLEMLRERRRFLAALAEQGQQQGEQQQGQQAQRAGGG